MPGSDLCSAHCVHLMSPTELAAPLLFSISMYSCDPLEKQSREPSRASILLRLEGHLPGTPGPASQNISDRHSLLRAGCRGATRLNEGMEWCWLGRSLGSSSCLCSSWSHVMLLSLFASVFASAYLVQTRGDRHWCHSELLLERSSLVFGRVKAAIGILQTRSLCVLSAA